MKIHAKTPTGQHLTAEVQQAGPVVDPESQDVGILFMFENGDREIIEADAAEFRTLALYAIAVAGSIDEVYPRPIERPIDLDSETLPGGIHYEVLSRGDIPTNFKQRFVTWFRELTDHVNKLTENLPADRTDWHCMECGTRNGYVRNVCRAEFCKRCRYCGNKRDARSICPHCLAAPRKAGVK